MRRRAVSFLAYLRDQRNCSPETIRAYRSDLALFLAWLESRGSGGTSPGSIDPLVIRAFLGHLHERRESRTTTFSMPRCRVAGASRRARRCATSGFR